MSVPEDVGGGWQAAAMDDDARVPLAGAHLLASFFAAAPALGHPAIRARVPRVRAHLLTYLDTEGEQWLTPDELVLLHAERQLEPVDAVLRVGGVEVVVAALPGFCHPAHPQRSEEHTSELQSRGHLVCRLLLEKKKP